MDLALDSDVLAARTGDRDAFGRLVARYGGVVTSISLSAARNVAVSEEIAQDVFLAAWRDLASLRNPSSFLPWLRQLARHRALDVVRRSRRPGAQGALDEAAVVAAIDPRPGAEDALLQAEQTRALSTALDALDADAREVLTLFYREGQSVAQVARLLGLRDDTVKKRLSRARADLRAEVLTGFADAVEASAPGDDFARQVMIALPAVSPATAIVVGKGVLHLVAKWASVAAASAAGFAGLVAGGIPIVSSIRCEMKTAADARERRELERVGFVALMNLLVFSLGIPLLQRAAPAHARTYGTLIAVVFMTVHAGVFRVWLPRVRARRVTTADQARRLRRRAVWEWLSYGLVLAIVVFAWVR